MVIDMYFLIDIGLREFPTQNFDSVLMLLDVRIGLIQDFLVALAALVDCGQLGSSSGIEVCFCLFHCGLNMLKRHNLSACRAMFTTLGVFDGFPCFRVLLGPFFPCVGKNLLGGLGGGNQSEDCRFCIGYLPSGIIVSSSGLVVAFTDT